MESSPPRPRLDARKTNERPHVLIVSDDLDLCEFLAQGLPLGGFWASVIANGLQALEVFRLRQFDLVVVDADMQSFDSIEFLRRLRGTSELDPSRTSRTAAPVVVIQSMSGGSPIERAQVDDLGVASILTAPLDLDAIVRSLHLVFEEWRRDHPDAPLADSASLRAF